MIHSERLVKEYLESMGYTVKKSNIKKRPGSPDFMVVDLKDMYVGVNKSKRGFK